MAAFNSKQPEAVHIEHVDLIEDEIVLGLKDGTALVYSCQQILALQPVRIAAPESD